jgi:hypothetical protein
MKNIPAALNGNDWKPKIARVLLVILLIKAKHRQKMTYGEFDQLIQEFGIDKHRFATNYGYPAGLVGSAMKELSKKLKITIPPINALLVNKKTDLPGHGIEKYLEDYSERRNLPKSIKGQQLSNAVIEDVFDFDWSIVINYLNIEIDELARFLISKAETKNGLFKKKYQEKILRRGGKGESDSHRNLKELLYNKSSVVEKYLEFKCKHKYLEYGLLSADKIDVVYENKYEILGIEVKSVISDECDIVRGIFQCVKYQAILNAEMKINDQAPFARSVLIIENEITRETKNIAKSLKVEVWRLTKKGKKIKLIKMV